MVSIVSIVLIVSMVSIVSLSYILLAYGDEYNALGIRHPVNPTVCVFEPDALYTDNVEGVTNLAYNAIDLWKEGLAEYSPNGNWEMPVYTIPIENHKYKSVSEFPSCNILITFEYLNDQTQSLGYTYIDFSKSYHKYTHITIFLHDFKVTPHYELNLGELEQEYTHTTFKIIPFSMIAIQNIITHEFGHALGSGHYKITDYPVYTADKPWINTSAMYYAINTAYDDVVTPKYVDIIMVERIYGEDGFGGMTTPPIRTGYYTVGDDEICTHDCKMNRFIFGLS